MRITIVSLSDPWASSHGGTMRTKAFARAFVALGHEVSCLFPSSEQSPEVSDRVERVPVPPSALGIRRWPGWVRAMKRALLPMPTQLGGRSEAMLAEVHAREPDLIVVSVLPYVWYSEQTPASALWLDHSDLYSDFIEREISARRGLLKVAARRQQRHLVALEDSSSTRAAVTTAAGLADAEMLQGRVDRRVPWLPTPVTDRLPEACPRSGDGPPAAGFIANFAFGPNLDALQLLNRTWAPRLLDMGWRVVVAGLASTEVTVAPGVEVLGPVADVSDFYDVVDVTLAPIRLGGGMKVKVVESLAYGRPVIATDFAMAGFPDEFRDLVEIVDAETPSFETLAAGPPALRADTTPHLLTFTQSGFTDRIAHMLRDVP